MSGFFRHLSPEIDEVKPIIREGIAAIEQETLHNVSEELRYHLDL
jgi:hypothetical protein